MVVRRSEYVSDEEVCESFQDFGVPRRKCGSCQCESSVRVQMEVLRGCEVASILGHGCGDTSCGKDRFSLSDVLQGPDPACSLSWGGDKRCRAPLSRCRRRLLVSPPSLPARRLIRVRSAELQVFLAGSYATKLTVDTLVKHALVSGSTC